MKNKISNEEPFFVECISCDKQIDINTSNSDCDDNYFCTECWEELAPVMEAEYKKSKLKGDIE